MGFRQDSLTFPRSLKQADKPLLRLFFRQDEKGIRKVDLQELIGDKDVNGGIFHESRPQSFHSGIQDQCREPESVSVFEPLIFRPSCLQLVL